MESQRVTHDWVTEQQQQQQQCEVLIIPDTTLRCLVFCFFSTYWPKLLSPSGKVFIRNVIFGNLLLLFAWIGVSVQFSSVAQLCPTLRDPMNPSTPGLPVHHQLPEFTETHVHRVGDAIQPSHPLSSPSPPAPSPSQHQSLFQWINSSHEVAKVLEFQL